MIPKATQQRHPIQYLVDLPFCWPRLRCASVVRWLGSDLLATVPVTVEKMKRPLTIWLTQATLLIVSLLLGSLFLFNLVTVLKHPNLNASLVTALLVNLILLFLILPLLVAFWGLVKRTVTGRWMSVICLLIILAFMVLINVWRPSGPNAYYQYENNAQILGAVLCQGTIYAFLLTLILQLSFSRKITSFFSASPDVDSLKQSA
jgi:hypothetical protein